MDRGGAGAEIRWVVRNNGTESTLTVQDGFNQLFSMSKEPDSCKLSSKGLVLFLKRNTLHMEGEKHPSVPTSLHAEQSYFPHFNAELNALWNSIRFEVCAVKSFLQTSLPSPETW